MLINQLISDLNYTLGLNPTASQQELFNKLAAFTLDPEGKPLLLVKGFAGTGKTSSLSAYVKVLIKYGFKVVLLAPTGRAAKVFSAYAGTNAFTIHKKIYRQKSSKDGMAGFALDKNLSSHTIFIVDEASMISNRNSDLTIFGSGFLLNDLIEYVYNNRDCRLILVGDTAQLPPVGADMSPALEQAEVKTFGVSITEIELTDVVRQTEQSGILKSATSLRQKLTANDFALPLFSINGFRDIEVIDGMEFKELLGESYSKSGIDDTLVICRSNKRAVKYNQGIRNQILWREEMLSPGDLLMVVRNNYYWLKDLPESAFIANGDIVEILKIYKQKEIYGFRFAQCLLRLVDYEIEIEAEVLLDVLESESAALKTEDNKRLFYTIMEDYADLQPKRRQYDSVKTNPYFNALQVKYAYAVTCHKAQGGQWKDVYVDAGYLTNDMIDREYLRWLYTAITRATGKVYLVNFKEEVIES